MCNVTLVSCMMATPSTFAKKPLLYNAKYKCEKCGEKWKARKSTGGVKNCVNDKCNNFVHPYKKEAIDKLVCYECVDCGNRVKEKRTASEANQIPFCRICHQQNMTLIYIKSLGKPKRMFGEFTCPKCQRSWKSGNAWEGKGQKCKKCDKLVYPQNLRPLLPRMGEKKSEPHDQKRCQMCQELGYNCKLKPRDNELEIDDDDFDDNDDELSVITENSSVTMSREGSLTPDLDEADLTPTEDNIDDDLTSAIGQLAEMKINSK